MFFGLYLTFGFLWRMIRTMRRCGGIGRHKGLKIPRWKHRTGSSPVSGTSREPRHAIRVLRFFFFMVHPSRLRLVMNTRTKKREQVGRLALFFINEINPYGC